MTERENITSSGRSIKGRSRQNSRKSIDSDALQAIDLEIVAAKSSVKISKGN